MSFLLLLLPQIASAQFDDFLKGVDKLASPGANTLGDDKIISGLKEALGIGVENRVNLTGSTDGFVNNEAIKILLPEKPQSMDKALRLAGFGPQVDEVVTSMNPAALASLPFSYTHF